MNWILGYLVMSAVATVGLSWLICRAKATECDRGYCDCAQGRLPCNCKGVE